MGIVRENTLCTSAGLRTSNCMDNASANRVTEKDVSLGSWASRQQRLPRAASKPIGEPAAGDRVPCRQRVDPPAILRQCFEIRAAGLTVTATDLPNSPSGVRAITLGLQRSGWTKVHRDLPRVHTGVGVRGRLGRARVHAEAATALTRVSLSQVLY